MEHRKNSPLIRIDGDTVQLQRTEYDDVKRDVDVHGVRLAVAMPDVQNFFHKALAVIFAKVQYLYFRRKLSASSIE